MIESAEKKKSGYLAIVGPTNAGKSTLMNKIVGMRIASVCHKVQTTATCLSGIAHRGAVEYILLDTPGLFHADKKTRSQSHIMRHVTFALERADSVLLLLDASLPVNVDLIKKVKTQDRPVYLALNKVDNVPKKEELLACISEYDKLKVFEEIFLISALKNSGVDYMMERLGSVFEEKDWLFTRDDMTTMTQREIAIEMMRGVFFQRFNNELPYSTEFKVVRWTEEDDRIGICLKVVVQSSTHKGIVVGHKGEGVAYLRTKTERRLQSLFGGNVRVSVEVVLRK